VGPGSDLTPDRSIDPKAGSWRILFAVVAGIVLAVLVATASTRGMLPAIAQYLMRRKDLNSTPPGMATAELQQLQREGPQGEAHVLLQRAVNHDLWAVEQIQNRAAGWQGKLRLDPDLDSLITNALNSSDLRVRAAAIELNLAALHVAKTPESVQRLSKEAQSGPQSQRVWALWELGLLANRGVETESITQLLVSQLQDPNEGVRHWAVEGLAYVGTNNTIPPLLYTFRTDPSRVVRERAASGISHSGMLSHEQRRAMIPELLDLAEDSSLDPQMHTWVFQALHDISGQNLASDAKTWRKWYYSSL